MADIPNNVVEIMNAPSTVKVLVTASKDGKPHAIVAGSIGSPAADTVIVGEILMKTSSKNLKENSEVTILLASGKDAYSIDCVAKARLDQGPEIEMMNEALKAMNLKASAVWVFNVKAVYDQGASPNAGKKLA